MSGLPFYRSTLFYMLAAILLGMLVGVLAPQLAANLDPLAVGFIQLIKVFVGLIVFLTLALGIAHIGNAGNVGRVGLRALLYFEVVSSVALCFGLLMAHLCQPGTGMHIQPASLDAGAVAGFTETAHHHADTNVLLEIIPHTFVGAFAEGNLLQILLLAVLFGFALLHLKKRVAPLVTVMEALSESVFTMITIIMKASPLAVFAATCYAVGKYGFATFALLWKLAATLYISCALFILVVFGCIAYWSGFSLWRFMLYLWDEILLVYATASSEVALPRLIAKLENAGCDPSVVGFVVPTGYSFNLDGSALYMTLAGLFIAQAVGVQVTWMQELSFIGVLLITSKGIASVPAASLVTLAAALAFLPGVPVAGIALILGIDRFMDSMRSVTNFLGNAVAAMAIAKWESLRDDTQTQQALLNKKSA